MQRDKEFERKYKVIIQKIGGGPNLRRENSKAEESKEVRTYREETKNTEVPLWAYKVFSGDNNYSQRTDKSDDFMDFDPDQSWQIEAHY